jgi:hypothetical protein
MSTATAVALSGTDAGTGAAVPLTSPGLDQTVGSMVAGTTTLESGSAIAEDLDRIFKADRELDCVVILDGGRPTHLVTREHYYSVTGGPYGFTLYQKKPAEMVAKAQPLIVGQGVAVRALAKLALARRRDDQYDPVIVTGDALREICTCFDREKLDLFRPPDRERGSFEASDEKGNPIRVPLTTLSLAAITSRALGEERHPAIFSQLAAGLRRTAKGVTAALGRSGFALNDWRS